MSDYTGRHGGRPLFCGYPSDPTKTREFPIGTFNGRLSPFSVKANYGLPGGWYGYCDRVVTTTEYGPQDLRPYCSDAFMGGGWKQTTLVNFPPHWPRAHAPAPVTFTTIANVVRDSVPSLTEFSSAPYRYPNVMVTDGITNYRFAPTLPDNTEARLYAIVAMKNDEGIEAYVYDDFVGRYPGAIDLTQPL